MKSIEALAEAKLVWPHPTLSAPHLIRRGLFQTGLAILGGGTLIALTSRDAQAVDYNTCEPSETERGPVGVNLTTYCDNSDGEFQQVFRPDLLEIMKKVPTQERPISTAPYTYADLMQQLVVQFHAFWDRNADVEQACMVIGLVGNYQRPFGGFRTDWFAEQDFNRINYANLRWEKRLVHQLQLLDKTSQEVAIPQTFISPEELVRPTTPSRR